MRVRWFICVLLDRIPRLFAGPSRHVGITPANRRLKKNKTASVSPDVDSGCDAESRRRVLTGDDVDNP